MELTKEFAKFVVETYYEDIPPQVLDEAKLRLMDTIGAILSGRTGWVYGDAFLGAMRELDGGNAQFIGERRENDCFPASRAAMINATFAHAIELDDGHKYAGVHAGAVAVPTALAMGKEFGATGKEILAAIVIGYELIYRLAVAQSPELIDHGFHPSATCDTIGAMAIAGKLMKIDERQMANGLGMAVLQASGLMEATVSGQQSKCIMVGNAAYNGISCAYLARAGLEGCLTAFEGKSGLFRAMSRLDAAEHICDGLGQQFLISDTYNKFYPTCRHSQPAIEGVLNLAVKHSIDPEQVREIRVGTHRVAYELTGIIHEPKSPGEARFSIPYGSAVALLDHGVAVRHLRKDAYTQKRYLDLARLVTVRMDDKVNSYYPKRRGAVVEIEMKDGTVYTEECYDLKGSPLNPVGRKELIDKFAVAANGIFSEQKIQKITECCLAFERESSADALLSELMW